MHVLQRQPGSGLYCAQLYATTAATGDGTGAFNVQPAASTTAFIVSAATGHESIIDYFTNAVWMYLTTSQISFSDMVLP